MNDTDSIPSDKTSREEIEIKLVDAGGDPRPMAIRVRQVLKLCLRGFHLKCTEARGLGLEGVSHE